MLCIRIIILRYESVEIKAKQYSNSNTVYYFNVRVKNKIVYFILRRANEMLLYFINSSSIHFL